MNSLKTDKTLTKRSHSCFEWVQLLATICIPVVIAIYTIVENQNSSSIAADNQAKDVQIANVSRTTEFEIAQASRSNEIRIAEQSREKDRDLALDQQHETILVEYQTFLANLLFDNGLTLNKSPSTKTVGRFMTLTALNRLDPGRKSFLIQSLYEAKLITSQKNSKTTDQSILDLQRVNLKDVTLDTSRNSRENELSKSHFIIWSYAYLPGAILTNASLRHVRLDCANFSMARMDAIDFSFSLTRMLECFDVYRDYLVDFSDASLINGNFYKVSFFRVNFNWANMTLANMYEFACFDCSFVAAVFIQVEMSFATFKDFLHDKLGIQLRSAELKQTTAHSAVFRTADFGSSKWSEVNASEIKLNRCLFTSAELANCSFINGEFEETSFVQAKLFHVDLSYSKLSNVTFRNAYMNDVDFSSVTCDYCDFRNVAFENCILENSSFRYSNFFNSDISMQQLQQTFDLTGSILPDGTRFQENTFS